MIYLGNRLFLRNVHILKPTKWDNVRNILKFNIDEVLMKYDMMHCIAVLKTHPIVFVAHPVCIDG